MIKIKKRLVYFLISLFIIFGIIAFMTNMPFAFLSIGGTLVPSPKVPKITVGRFHVSFVYECNNTRYKVNDILICKYDGIGINAGIGKYRKWVSSYASGKEKLILLDSKKAIRLKDTSDDVIKQVVYYDPGPAAYYMGDSKIEYEKGNSKVKPYIYLNEINRDGSESDMVLSSKELMKYFKIKLISWEHSAPIKNTFN